MKKNNLKLIEDPFNSSVILFKDKGTWVAKCLSYNIAAQGNTMYNALNSLEKTINGQIILDIDNGVFPLETTPKTLYLEKKILEVVQSC